MPRRAIVLLSGGIDSATTLAVARAEGYQVHAISFDYGQRHAVELRAAQRVARELGVVEHRIVWLDLRAFGGSALTDSIPVPKARRLEEIATTIPPTYVPARNTIFLAYALAFGEVRQTGDLFIGVNALDCSGYPDCRPEYIRAFEAMANRALKATVEGKWRVRIHTPLSAMTKGQIIRKGIELGVDFSWTLSCYDPTPDGRACGTCDACLLRKKGFAEAGVPDPTPYASTTSSEKGESS